MPEIASNKKLDNKPKTVVSLDYCVNSALADIMAGDERYEQFLKWAIDGYRMFHFDMAREVKTVELDLLPYKAVDFPSDMIDWVKVGIRCGNMVKTFVHDDNMPWIWDTENCEKAAHSTCNIEDATVLTDTRYWFYDEWGQDEGKLFGLVVKDNGLGYMSISNKFKQFQFSAHVKSTSKIYLEYLADGIKVCDKTNVTLLAYQLIVNYIHWKRMAFNTSSASWQVKEAKGEFWDEWNRVGFRMFDLTIDDILQASRDAYMLAPYQ